MKTLRKPACRDFRVLNLSDPQLSDGEWARETKERALLEYTVNALAERTLPDLITISGDLAWAGNYDSYRKLASLIDGFDIPWAFVFGNHDIQEGREKLERAVDILTAGGKCLFEKGDPALGFGNYTIGIEQDGRLIHGLIFMDSHDRREYAGKDGKRTLEWADIDKAQFPWYREQTEKLKEAGAKESTLITHIPLYTYRQAAEAAFVPGFDPRSVEPYNGMQSGSFTEEYRDSFGVMYEDICSYPEDNGFFDLIKECGSTKTVLCGHDHVNTFGITYRGVLLMYALKTGSGCYFDRRINGGTLLKINAEGRLFAEQVFVNPEEVSEGR